MDKTQLRRFSRFLYPHIHRFDYGWDSQDGRIRVPKPKLQKARSIGTYRYLQKLSERHLKRHILRETTYYYTGARNERYTLLLCVDIDAHNGECDALDVARYLNFWWFDDTGYIEPSTNGLGIHLYFLMKYPEYTPNQELKTLFNELAGMMAKQVEWEGFESKVCMIGGLPSDWTNDTMATLIKLPRPQDELQMKVLLALKIWPLDDLRTIVQRNLREHPSFSSEDKLVAPHLPSSLFLLNDCNPEGVEGPPLPHSPANVIDEVRGKDALYRALWTVRTLSHVLGRMPTVMESLDLYDRLQMGTGNATEARVRRFEWAVNHTSKTYDPSKRRSFTRLYPVLRTIIERAIESHPTVRLGYDKARKVSVESLCVGYYFALWQLSKDPTLPIDGMIGLNAHLKKAKAVEGSIGYQKASAIRNILSELEILEPMELGSDEKEYTFGNGQGRAKRYRLKARLLD